MPGDTATLLTLVLVPHCVRISCSYCKTSLYPEFTTCICLKLKKKKIKPEFARFSWAAFSYSHLWEVWDLEVSQDAILCMSRGHHAAAHQAPKQLCGGGKCSHSAYGKEPFLITAALILHLHTWRSAATGWMDKQPCSAMNFLSHKHNTSCFILFFLHICILIHFEQRLCPFDILLFCWQQRLWLSCLCLLCFVCVPLPLVNVTACHAVSSWLLTSSPGKKTSGAFEMLTLPCLPGGQVLFGMNAPLLLHHWGCHVCREFGKAACIYSGIYPFVSNTKAFFCTLDGKCSNLEPSFFRHTKHSNYLMLMHQCSTDVQ